MNQAFLIKYCTLLLLLGSSASKTHATAITPILRPENPAITLKATVEEENEGGFITDILHLRCSKFQLEAEPPPENWVFFKKKNTSLALRPISGNGIELTYSFYPKGEFIEVLEPEKIMGYVEGLTMTYGEPENSSITLLNEAQAFAPQKPVVKIKRPDGTYRELKRTLGRYPLGQSYKIVEYEVTTIDEQENETKIQYMDYILIFNDYTLLAQFKAPSEIFGKIRTKVDLFIRTTQDRP